MRELERETPTNATRDRVGPSIALIGQGRLGTAIAREATAVGLVVRIGRRDSIEAACSGMEVAILCVPDAEIEPACAVVTAAERMPRFVGHVSGATRLDALASARDAGCHTFSLHPLQTIPDGEAVLAGAPAAISGSDAEAAGLAHSLAVTLGMRPFEVPEEARSGYHAAASIASNFLVALEESAVDALRAAGIENGRELLAPLVLRTAANWAEQGPAALTGPIARGDERTVAAHLDVLRAASPELVPLYEALAERTRAVATRHRIDR
jgi:predicted short-subunit dehydrogenase-like oxidoreductase (DUF2520 family)